MVHLVLHSCEEKSSGQYCHYREKVFGIILLAAHEANEKCRSNHCFPIKPQGLPGDQSVRRKLEELHSMHGLGQRDV